MHLPKTGGSSFRAMLQERYGERLLLDYDDKPLAHEPAVRNAMAKASATDDHQALVERYDCIHGHFLPLKYQGMKEAHFITWLRDPVERVASRYFFSRRKWEDDGELPRHPAVRQLFDEAGGYPTLEEFAKLPAFQNTYAQYLWGFSLERFEMIGIVERWDESVAKLAAMIGLETAAQTRLNANPEREQERYDLEPATHALIMMLNEQDQKIYEYALSR